MPENTAEGKKGGSLPPKPHEPQRPDTPYDFSDFVRVVQKDFYYGRSIHRIVDYGRRYGKDAELWALGILAHHVSFPPRDLDELGVKEANISDKCTNNTKFYMLDFTKWT